MKMEVTNPSWYEDAVCVCSERLGRDLTLGTLCCPGSISFSGRRTWEPYVSAQSFFPSYLIALTSASDAATCSATKPLCNRNTHSSDSSGFSINQALRGAMTYIVSNMEIEECLSYKKSLTHFEATNPGTPGWGRFLSTLNTTNANNISLSPRTYTNSINLPNPATKGQLWNTP